MVSSFGLYLILAGFAVAMYLIQSITQLVFPRIKKLRAIILTAIIIALIAIRLLVINHVYIINDNDQWKNYYLLIPSSYQIEDGQFAQLIPYIGWGANCWIINNGSRPAYYEQLIYGKKQEIITASEIGAYQLQRIKQIDYWFEPPPRQIDSFLPVRHIGWLYR